MKQGAQRQSVVGMFDDRADAMRAQAAIRSAGIAEVDVNLLPADEVGPQGLTDEEFARYKEAIHFLFATGADDEADLYVEALRRGATLVTATTDDASRVDELRAILKRCNAVDLAGRKDQLSTPARSATPAEVAADKAKG